MTGGRGGQSKKASERQKLQIKRQVELVTEEQRKGILDSKISICKDSEALECMVCSRDCSQMSTAAARRQG